MNELNEIFQRLKESEYRESVFSRIMHATSVQELIDSHFDPEDLVPLFAAAEELGAYEEEILFFTEQISQNIKNARPVIHRRAFFI